jgi:uncharacterized membrane protein
MSVLVSNLLWLAVAAIAFSCAPRRTLRATLALIGALVLLFPVISIADDFLDRNAMNEVQAIAVAPVVIVSVLIALAAVEVERRSRASRLLVAHADPRSPPRA